MCSIMETDGASRYSDITKVEGVPEEWTYTMRREMQEIVPGVFLGPYAAAGKKNFNDLKERGITHIVCVRQDIEKNFIKPNFQDVFQYLVVELADTFTENLIPKIPEVKQFMDNCLKGGGKVLLHCNSGMSRAPSLVIAYIMEKYGLDFRTALEFVQQRRFCIQPNDAFEQQLQEYEPIYQARVTLAGQVGSGHKRGREEDEEEVVQNVRLCSGQDENMETELN